MNTMQWVDYLKTLPRKVGETPDSVLRRGYKYRYMIKQPSHKAEAKLWLDTNCPNEEFVFLVSSVHIRDEMIALQFKLIFSHCLS